MQRLGTTAECWHTRIVQLFSKPRWLGSFCATHPERLKEIAIRRGLHHVDNAMIVVAAG